ncbi:MAG: putative DNA-binding protein [Candidatus Izimaplasma bacterium HR2]|nr:MAG: putative DNA-binding protein [Candidatus Izimaplasma bacterium HR2]
MDILEKALGIIELYDLYQALLTDKQKEYFESYYFDNFSITEISENMNVSRNAIHDQLKKTVNKLNDFEEKLNLKRLGKERKNIINKLIDVSKDEEVIGLLTELKKVE